MISGFDNLALFLTIKDTSDLFIYVYIDFSQSGLRKLMSSIIYSKYARVLIVNLSHLQQMDKIFFDGFITLKDVFVYINSSPPIVANSRQWTGSALIQIMAWRLFGTKPLPEPTLAYCQWDP